ncbi:class I SAM-dependent methyltransferase [Desulfosarcina sp. OttesenSCG-928-A07]|nr:class I SAM-dependent methyltransferase [Desulfosarcina sp. OttesenSCG-928-G17]MDL2328625.1 class I SAM-dependent methyltransferase [Desulfosarcina sp. OttesenSCG-928-A07]
MEKIPDWLRLWEDLARIQDRYHTSNRARQKKQDAWQGRARKFDGSVKKRWTRPDASRDFLIRILEQTPNATVVDIGAGTGAWAVLMARHARQITAVEPSDAMCAIMEEKLAAENITNVTLVKGSWPEVEVAPHDICFASHSMYGIPDFKGFVMEMIRKSRQRCFLLLRVLAPDGVMAKAALRVWGQPFDSPNFQVAYNALLQMEICPDVIMETPGGWEPWTHDSIEAALDEVRRRFDLGDDHTHDDFLYSLLETSLKHENNRYVWPIGTRSGMIHWCVDKQGFR